MTKQLYLMRHAEAVEKLQQQTDKDRELTSAGVQQSIKIGAFLSEKNFNLDIIFCSAAERSKQSAMLCAERLKPAPQILEAELYDASVRTFLQFINQFDNAYINVMCIGHNPTISYLTEFITGSEIGSMTTAGTAIIKFNITEWKEVSQGNGELIHYITPENAGMF